MRAHVLRERAALLQSPCSLEHCPDPVPRSGQVRIRVHACAACRTDLHVVTGDLPVRRAPLVPGHQVVGSIDALGAGVTGFALGERVGGAWLHATCGRCRFCLRGAENLCHAPDFTGYTRDGGFAELMIAEADFIYSLPTDLSDEQAAPLLCAGIIGYRCLRSTGLEAQHDALIALERGVRGADAIQVAAR